MAVSHSETFELLKAYSRSLFHKVRTPLSVVSNDLFYLKNEFPAGDLERPIRKSELIGNLLKEKEKHFSNPLPVDCDIYEIFRMGEIGKVPPGELKVRVDKEKLQFAVSQLTKLISLTFMSSEIENSRSQIHFSCLGDVHEPKQFVTTFLSESGQEESTAVIDIALLSAGVDIYFSQFERGTVRCTLSIPSDYKV